MLGINPRLNPSFTTLHVACGTTAEDVKNVAEILT
jgi:hypothetical protein